jgi:hypothetical protein
MDQEYYYSLDFDIDSKILDKEFNEILNEQYQEFNKISNKSINITINNDKDLKHHIDNLYLIIYDYIKIDGLNSKLLIDLKREINRYALKCKHKDRTTTNN